jgi:hypothetical protein
MNNKYYLWSFLKNVLMILPIIFISALILAPDQSILFLNTILGKCVVVLAVVLYGIFDWIYGVFVALLAIVLYQSGIYESMTLLGDPDYEVRAVPLPPSVEPPAESDPEVAAHCEPDGNLVFKNVIIEHPEYSQYIFDRDVKFMDNDCNVCSSHCRGEISR